MKNMTAQATVIKTNVEKPTKTDLLMIGEKIVLSERFPAWQLYLYEIHFTRT